MALASLARNNKKRNSGVHKALLFFLLFDKDENKDRSDKKDGDDKKNAAAGKGGAGGNERKLSSVTSVVADKMKRFFFDIRIFVLTWRGAFSGRRRKVAFDINAATVISESRHAEKKEKQKGEEKRN